MNRKSLWFIIVLIIVAVVVVGISLVNMGNREPLEPGDNKAVANNTNSVSTTQRKNVNASYNEKMIEGKILNISEKPLSFTIAAELGKIFPGEGTATKTIMTTQDTAFLLHNLDTGKNSNLDISTLKVGD